MFRSRGRALCVIFSTVALAAAAVQAYVAFVPYSLSWNLTESIPTGLYWSRVYAGEQPHRGDLVCFRYREPSWAAGRDYFPGDFRLCKPVAGVAGDIVRKNADTVDVINHDKVVAHVSVALADRKGRSLSTESLAVGVVPAGKLVLLAPRYPNSFDSRYVGLVSVGELTHQVWPLWVKE